MAVHCPSYKEHKKSYFGGQNEFLQLKFNQLLTKVTPQLQAANDTSLMVKRMWRYLGPSILLAVIMNISKFFELTIIQHEDGTYGYDLTPLRRNTTYSAVTNWMRLIFMGAVPLVIIIFFNFKVYQDVRERSLRNFKRKSTKFPKSSAKVKVSYVFLNKL